MRFKSNQSHGYTVYAVCGVYSASFAVDFSKADTTGLLGFAIERYDPQENERYFMPNTKVFESVVPNPAPEQCHSSRDHPIQSFVWDDFTTKPGYRYQYFFYPVTGQPKNLIISDKPVSIWVQAELDRDTSSPHDVFFNRGCASSQAYARKFDNLAPSEITDSKRRAEAEAWLSRGLDQALLKFIQQAKKGDALRACFYEFHYEPVVKEFADAIQRGVDVKIIMDAKINRYTDKKGKLHESFPRVVNEQTVKGLIPSKYIIKREANKNDLQHNKFIVYLKGADRKATAVWTGSTNVSEGGIFGQTNVGHWVRDTSTAECFLNYWELLSKDPGNKPTRSDGKKNNATYKKANLGLHGDLTCASADQAPNGICCIFSPRPNDSMLKTYCSLLDSAHEAACITLAFGVSQNFKDVLQDNTARNAITFLLLEKEDKPTAKNQATFVRLTARNNIYQAYGACISSPLYQWTREVTTQQLHLNTHVKYIHTKFMLVDPLSEEPLVITGSANFSKPSTVANDENMLVIKGDHRVADIYFTEFMRLFSHYYFRSVFDQLSRQKAQNDNNDQDGPNADNEVAKENQKKNAIQKDSIFLETTDKWLTKYREGSYRRKRLNMFVDMAEARTLT